MAEEKIFGYKKIFGIILPDWVTEKMIRNVAWSTLSVVAMLFVLVLVISPRKSDIKSLELSLATDTTNLELLKKSRDGVERMGNELNAQETSSIMAAMPLEYSPERAIFVLRQIAADTGVTIISYTLPSGTILDSKDSKLSNTKKEMVELLSYIIKLTVSAPVDVILKFVSKIESSLPYGLVSDLNLQEVTKLTKIDSSKNVQLALELKYFQSRVNPINLNKIETLTSKDLENARALVGYNLFTLPEEVVTGEVATGSGNIFGI